MARMTKSMFSWWKLYLFAVMLVTKSSTFNCCGNFGKLLHWTSANLEKMPDFVKSISSVVGHKLPWVRIAGLHKVGLVQLTYSQGNNMCNVLNLQCSIKVASNNLKTCILVGHNNHSISSCYDHGIKKLDH